MSPQPKPRTRIRLQQPAASTPTTTAPTPHATSRPAHHASHASAHPHQPALCAPHPHPPPGPSRRYPRAPPAPAHAPTHAPSADSSPPRTRSSTASGSLRSSPSAAISRSITTSVSVRPHDSPLGRGIATPPRLRRPTRLQHARPRMSGHIHLPDNPHQRQPLETALTNSRQIIPPLQRIEIPGLSRRELQQRHIRLRPLQTAREADTDSLNQTPVRCPRRHELAQACGSVKSHPAVLVIKSSHFSTLTIPVY